MNETLPSKKGSSPGRSDRECTCCTRAGGGGVAASTESRAWADQSTTLSALVIAAAASRSVRSASPHSALLESKALSPPERVSRTNWWSRRARSSTATAVGEPVRVSRSADEPCSRRVIECGETSRWCSEERAECRRQWAPEYERGCSPSDSTGRCGSSLGALCPGERC